MRLRYKLCSIIASILIVISIITINVSAATPLPPADDYSSLFRELFKDDPLRHDAAIYATHFGVTLNEGLRRLDLQITIGEMDGKLTEKESDTFAGLWIEHEPDFRVVALFTDNGEETIKPYLVPEIAEIIEIRQAETSLANLELIQNETTLAIEKLGLHVESEVNVFNNRVTIYVLDRETLDSQIQADTIELSPKVDIVTISTPSIKCTDVLGGMSLRTCTSGFGVVDSGGTRGITTAEHCDNYQTYMGADLTYITGTNGQYYDIQWHTVPAGYYVTNQIQYDVNLYRQITSTLGRSSQSIGTIVYKYGRATNQTVGQISSKTFDPGWFHTATFIRVDNIYQDTVVITAPGDSGGPWFVNNTAYGSHVGGIGADEYSLYDGYYMAVDYIYGGAGVTVLTSP